MKNIVLLIATIIITISCDETKKIMDTAGNIQLTGNYKITAIENITNFPVTPEINFNALEKSINGTTGCNRFFGSYNLDLYALSFSDIGATEMACDQPIMDVEGKFLNALYNTGSYTFEKGLLTLYSKLDRSILLTAQKEKAPQD